jgi:hypothetical protein
VTAELLDYGPDDVETILISHLKPMLTNPLFAGGNVANSRLAGDVLPFILVNHLDGEEDEDCGETDELVSVHTLFPKQSGSATARRNFRDGARDVHQRMLLLARYLVDVPLPSGRNADIDFVKVFKRPTNVDYGDAEILRKVGRYRIGLSYAKLS